MITQAFKFRWFELDGVKVAFDQYEVHDDAVNLIRKGLVTAILTESERSKFLESIK